MANKKKKEVSLSEMHVEELTRHLEKAREDLFKLKFRAVTAPVKNTMQIRTLKKDIARYHTFINQRRQQG